MKPHRIWLDAAASREEAFLNRNKKMVERYNRHARPLAVLKVGSQVILQDFNKRNRWEKTGVIVEHADRKYTIRMDGSGRIVTRNRRHIKLARHKVYEGNVTPFTSDPITFDNAEETCDTSVTLIPETSMTTESSPSRSRLPRPETEPYMLRRLRPHNNRGLAE